MDERTLNDLLECSVCLERLDTSSKVLPCQHTFCRKCLEVIVLSRHELRCPECRVLVNIKIDDLPPNILLMRILEGMKNASQNQNNVSKSSRQPIVTNLERKNDATESSKIVTNNQQNRASNDQQNPSNRCIVPHAFALYDFTPKDTGDLNFKKGDIIFLKRKLDVNWMIGELNGQEGAFPINFVQMIIPLPTPQCIALYDFKMGPNEEEGCLTFKKGAVINVLRRVDHNWAEGSIGLCIGIFPIEFVELNNLAKQLLDSGNVALNMICPRALPPIPFQNNLSDSSSVATTSPSSPCSSNTSSNSLPSSPSSSNSPQQSIQNRESKEKRHSLNVIMENTNLSIVQSNRHSAEILSIPDATEGTVNNENKPVPTSTSAVPMNRSKETTFPLQQSSFQQNTRSNVLKTDGKNTVSSLPWAYLALYPYKPRKPDELELKKGCVYFVTERCLDGWYKGRNWADKSGVFPGNYVTPLRSRDQQQLIHQRKVVHSIAQSQQTSSLQAPSSQSNQEQTNSPVHPPPELPPRSNTMPSSSVWTKPLGHNMESVFNKKLNNLQKNDSKSSFVDTKTSNSSNKSSNCNAVRETVTNHCLTAAQITKDKEKKETISAVSLMKRLANMKRSKSPTQSNSKIYSIDNPVFEDIANFSSPSSSRQTTPVTHPAHVRSGSCPSQLLQSLPIDLGINSPTSSGDPHSSYGSQRLKNHKERSSLQGLRQQTESNKSSNHSGTTGNVIPSGSSINKSIIPNSQKQSYQTALSSSNVGQAIHHRKTQSLDTNTLTSELSGASSGSKCSMTDNHTRESRFRCIVSYPSNSDLELELNVGDIVFVHRKQKNGWYKGTHARTNKTGLFPASFVEPDI